MEHLFTIISNGELRKALVKAGKHMDYYTMLEREHEKRFYDD